MDVGVRAPLATRLVAGFAPRREEGNGDFFRRRQRAALPHLFNFISRQTHIVQLHAAQSVRIHIHTHTERETYKVQRVSGNESTRRDHAISTRHTQLPCPSPLPLTHHTHTRTHKHHTHIHTHTKTYVHASRIASARPGMSIYINLHFGTVVMFFDIFFSRLPLFSVAGF